MKQMVKHKKIPCRIHKVDVGIYVTTPTPHIVIFSQIKKKYGLKCIVVLTCMLLHIKHIDYHQKRYLAKFINLLLAFMSSPSTPS